MTKSTSTPAAPQTDPSVHLDRPARASTGRHDIWGSDVLAEVLASLEIPFIALNPGASYRGLHDSIVNHLGNRQPGMLVCLHEEHAVAIAHGYAKVTGRPLAVALHSNVGLMHATMALFNAFCDRVPLLAIGADGPIDAAQRRPWIDWIHTSADQASLVRPYTKWDDRPGSVSAAAESIVRAHQVSCTYPHAPTYVCLDAGLQESRLDAAPPLPNSRRSPAPSPPAPAAAQVSEAVRLLAGSERTLILIGRVDRAEAAWSERIALADALDATVLTDLKLGAAFPTRHRRHPVVPGALLSPAAAKLIRSASVIVSLDWVDLAGSLTAACGDYPVNAAVIHCSMDHVLHNGWSKDGFGMAPVDLAVAAHPDEFVRALLAARGAVGAAPSGVVTSPREVADRPAGTEEITIRGLAEALRDACGDQPVSMLRLPLGWDGRDADFRHPLDYLGSDGGAGIGSGPGMAVGAALALLGSDRLPLAVLGDGDTLMGGSALWTAARHRIPLLVVVANNRSFYNDEMHQERIARQRGRPIENRWIGQHIRDPVPDLATFARSLGLSARGPVSRIDALPDALSSAVGEVRAGRPVLVDVHIEAMHYPIDTVSSVGRE